MSARVITVSASVSTDMRTEERYFVDARIGSRQVCRHLDADGIPAFLEELRTRATPMGIEVVFSDETTGELAHIS